MKRALIVGDSHADWTPFAKALASKVGALGYSVTRAGVGGTSARTWLKAEVCRPKKDKCVKVADLQKGGPWDLVLISLGTNGAANANKAGVDAGAQIAQRVKTLATKLAGKRTIWILPPTLRGNVEWYSPAALLPVYKHAGESGLELFDSRPVTEGVVTKKSGDGVHPGAAVGKAWADAVAKQVQNPDLGVTDPTTLGRLGDSTGPWGIIGLGLAAGVLVYWYSQRKD
jgi:lysophospholipase L1-like esterase